eukprot:tig00000076_g2369.t1
MLSRLLQGAKPLPPDPNAEAGAPAAELSPLGGIGAAGKKKQKGRYGDMQDTPLSTAWSPPPSPSPPPSFLPLSLPTHPGSLIHRAAAAPRRGHSTHLLHLHGIPESPPGRAPEQPRPRPPRTPSPDSARGAGAPAGEPPQAPQPALSGSLSAGTGSSTRLTGSDIPLGSLRLDPRGSNSNTSGDRLAAEGDIHASSSPPLAAAAPPTASFPCPCCDQVVPADPLPSEAELWNTVLQEAAREARREPTLAPTLWSAVLCFQSLCEALSALLAGKLAGATLRESQLLRIVSGVLERDPYVRHAARADLVVRFFPRTVYSFTQEKIYAVRRRDPACRGYWQPLLQYTGYQGLQAHRVAHSLWVEGRPALARTLQSLAADVFHIDIHPGARLGSGLLIDHGTGVVIGETAVVGDRVSILHRVYLGGNGREAGDRHPKVGHGALLGAGAVVLGSVRVGEGSRVAAGSVVLSRVPPRSSAVGVPARVVQVQTPPAASPSAATPPASPLVAVAPAPSLPAEAMDHSQGLDVEFAPRSLELGAQARGGATSGSPTPRGPNLCSAGLAAVVFDPS